MDGPRTDSTRMPPTTPAFATWHTSGIATIQDVMKREVLVTRQVREERSGRRLPSTGPQGERWRESRRGRRFICRSNKRGRSVVARIEISSGRRYRRNRDFTEHIDL